MVVWGVGVSVLGDYIYIYIYGSGVFSGFRVQGSGSGFKVQGRWFGSQDSGFSFLGVGRVYGFW